MWGWGGGEEESAASRTKQPSAATARARKENESLKEEIQRLKQQRAVQERQQALDERARLQADVERMKRMLAAVEDKKRARTARRAPFSSTYAKSRSSSPPAAPDADASGVGASSVASNVAAGAAAVADKPKFANLDTVQVQGLKKPELNGKLATIISFDEEKALYRCSIDGKRYLLRPSSLIRATYSPETALRGAPVQHGKAKMQTVRTVRMSTVAPNGGSEQLHVVPAVVRGGGTRTDRHVRDALPDAARGNFKHGQASG